MKKMIGKSMPRIRPCPSQRNSSEKPEMDLPSVIARLIPRKVNKVPRVMIIGWTRNATIMTPLSVPIAHHRRRLS